MEYERLDELRKDYLESDKEIEEVSKVFFKKVPIKVTLENYNETEKYLHESFMKFAGAYLPLLWYARELEKTHPHFIKK